MTFRMVFLADRMPVNGMWVPLKPPAAMNVAVVLAPPQHDGADERRQERDVGQRPADEVVAPVRGPVNDLM